MAARYAAFFFRYAADYWPPALRCPLSPRRHHIGIFEAADFSFATAADAFASFSMIAAASFRRHISPAPSMQYFRFFTPMDYAFFFHDRLTH